MRSFAVAVLALAACTTPKILTPDDAGPCGQNGVVCLTPTGDPSGMCCWTGQVCGGQQGEHTPVTCPEGACCASASANDLLGAKPPTKQRKAKP